MQLKSLLVWPCALSGLTAVASPIDRLKGLFRRGQQLDHDKIQSIPETLPNDQLGWNMKRFQPYFNTEGKGCWPYPAVDSEGNWSGGLATSGGQGGDCTDSVGQVYVDFGYYNGHYCIIYAYYAPKDQTFVGGGHRHEWESVALWFDSITSDEPTLQGAAVSKHGGYEKTTNIGHLTFHNGHPLAKYYVDFDFVGTHSMGWTSKVGGLQPAVYWDLLTDAARGALENTDWGHADFPLGYDFQKNMEDSYPF
ncbi:hypothetical protein E4U54_006102 [Claviceps lovelessii]|nr:hypothetical protein E4U54_006102 [Claviceps lovelessii]